ncbi:MAG: 30S ribosomal protein S4 [Candidatus Dojkabacteria bacterium]|uniref:Small ribosomal subunit protein uS4 n=1 Tax=Candidatus Dojkabacteria bacterium TaxID=2099670 RepID=A0A952AL94_9BACT|nr:30S ribosomal protein S4 [Candidatus Dojkabacteria bacterium]WKZ27881.1 MAG: 30S ribosomal protein S4 [Candidatus Dojkabacteria bacterium]
MARYTGPKWKISRRENADVYGSEKWRKRSTAPGVHPVSRGRSSEYAVQFREKQKVKRTYGLLERQFHNLYKKAIRLDGNSGTNLLQLLETRLDNVVYKLGLAKTRQQARQFVTHGHIKVNGNKVDIASYSVKVGDEISYSDKFAKSDIAKVIKAENKNVQVPEWLTGNQLKSIPTRDLLDQSINEQLIIELYSR